MDEKKNDLCERLFEFAVRVIQFLKTLPYSPKIKLYGPSYPKVLVPQVLIMRNLNPDPQKLIFQTRSEYLREMRESNYWLRIIKRTVEEIGSSECDYLVNESHELKRILGSIAQKFS